MWEVLFIHISTVLSIYEKNKTTNNKKRKHCIKVIYMSMPNQNKFWLYTSACKHGSRVAIVCYNTSTQMLFLQSLAIVSV